MFNWYLAYMYFVQTDEQGSIYISFIYANFEQTKSQQSFKINN